MYESYWQLGEKPFDSGADTRFYYPSESHQAAILKLRYAVENRRGGALLVGASGSGKTLLCAMLQEMTAEAVSPMVRIVFPQMPCREMLAYLANELTGAEVPSHQPDVQESVTSIEHYLIENAQQGHHAVVIVDEAQLVSDVDTLEALRLLLNFEFDGKPTMTLVLSGQPGLLPVLERMPELEERLGVKSLLRPFREHETAEYVNHRLSVAGAKEPIFEPEAMSTLHGLTHGIARRINRLCDLALLLGYAEERRSIGTEHLEAVNEELVAVVPE